MAGPRAGPQRELAVQGERSVPQRAHAYRVGSEVDAHGPPAARVGLHVVGVRALLALPVRTRSLVPQHTGGGGEAPVVADRHGTDAAGAVVGRQDVPVEEAQVSGAAAADRHQRAGQGRFVALQPVRGDRTVGRLAHRVEHVPGGRQGEIRGVGDAVHGSQQRQRAALLVHGRGEDTEAPCCREGADVGPSPPSVAVRHCRPLSVPKPFGATVAVNGLDQMGGLGRRPARSRPGRGDTPPALPSPVRRWPVLCGVLRPRARSGGRARGPLPRGPRTPCC